MAPARLPAALVVALSLFGIPGIRAQGTLSLRWSEEFGSCTGLPGCDANGLDTNKWSYDLYDGSQYGLTQWGNGELQCYTNLNTNIRVASGVTGADGGALIINNLQSKPAKPCGPTSFVTAWTSARIHTRGKASFVPRDAATPLRIEARVQLPLKKGTWPAFWMLPEPPTIQWCTAGEIDIMEAKNTDGIIQQTIHFGGTLAQSWVDCRQETVTTGVSTSTSAWHVVAVEWSLSTATVPGQIKYYVNGVLVKTIGAATWYSVVYPDKTTSPDAPFDKPFHLLINMAVCGNYVGSTCSPAQGAYKVDWIRVYDRITA
ncbi:hypothetical protein HYH03_003322 [Edaphochlamys debaryana]|uniref:GH16 domain-containing protein n=1 Tax=Edaphochlamys debaryana TaxID=47281 RepID=A0A835Y9N8_9CHLO|nr:hypothetical protein HYH03_003322 [Edaphochlamys debaryana]|eukprot:KAG2498571.1 hypothetical protein HYH03_003322 [Edaphochlamys debaryana]